MSLVVQGLCKRYGSSLVFENVSFQVARGEFVAVMGESGIGKSTLLNCVAGLEEWDSGTIHVDGQDLGRLSADQRALLRRRSFGFVFQAFHVLPHLDVSQNVALPLMLLGRTNEALVLQTLADVGLTGFERHLPQQLSGGQLQRVAIARALIHQPSLLLADEPTGNLDPGKADLVLDLMALQTRRHGSALLLATHSASAASKADRVLHLRGDGILPANVAPSSQTGPA